MTQAVLFVCLGNICRSPLAEGIFRNLVEGAGLTSRFLIDSAGTGAWHVGNPPDPRSIAIASKYGVNLTSQRARKVATRDLETFDVVLAMDRENLTALKALTYSPKADLRMLLNEPPVDVPDPYFGGTEGFEDAFMLIRTGCERLLNSLT